MGSSCRCCRACGARDHGAARRAAVKATAGHRRAGRPWAGRPAGGRRLQDEHGVAGCRGGSRRCRVGGPGGGGQPAEVVGLQVPLHGVGAVADIHMAAETTHERLARRGSRAPSGPGAPRWRRPPSACRQAAGVAARRPDRPPPRGQTLAAALRRAAGAIPRSFTASPPQPTTLSTPLQRLRGAAGSTKPPPAPGAPPCPYPQESCPPAAALQRPSWPPAGIAAAAWWWQSLPGRTGRRRRRR